MKSVFIFLGSQVFTFLLMNMSIWFRPLLTDINMYTKENYYYLWNSLLYLAYINNIYQIVSHIQTGIKFYMNYKNLQVQWNPPGAQDDQESWMFITSSVIDLLGWLWMFYLFDIWNLFYMYLAWTHFTVCFLSFLDHDFFQEKYIMSTNITNTKDKIFLWTRIIFVWVDALARSIISITYCDYLINT